MLIKKIQDNKKRNFFFKLEFLKKIYKILVINFLNIKKYNTKKIYIYYKLLKLQAKINIISKTQIKNRCILSNRNKAVLRKHGISRIKMLEFLKFGILPGYHKAAW